MFFFPHNSVICKGQLVTLLEHLNILRPSCGLHCACEVCVRKNIPGVDVAKQLAGDLSCPTRDELLHALKHMKQNKVCIPGIVRGKLVAFQAAHLVSHTLASDASVEALLNVVKPWTQGDVNTWDGLDATAWTLSRLQIGDGRKCQWFVGACLSQLLIPLLDQGSDKASHVKAFCKTILGQWDHDSDMELSDCMAKLAERVTRVLRVLMHLLDLSWVGMSDDDLEEAQFMADLEHASGQSFEVMIKVSLRDCEYYQSRVRVVLGHKEAFRRHRATATQDHAFLMAKDLGFTSDACAKVMAICRRINAYKIELPTMAVPDMLADMRTAVVAFVKRGLEQGEAKQRINFDDIRNVTSEVAIAFIIDDDVQRLGGLVKERSHEALLDDKLSTLRDQFELVRSAGTNDRDVLGSASVSMRDHAFA